MRYRARPSPPPRHTLALAMVLAVSAAGGQGEPRGGKDTPTRAELLTRVEAQEPAIARARAELQGTSPEADDCLALAQLAVIEARMAVESPYWSLYGAEYVDGRLSSAAAALDLARDHKPLPIVPGELLERAYFASNDGTVQCYHVFVPDGYDPARPTPAILFCHGYDPYTTKIFPWVPERFQSVVDEIDALFVIPYGRRNTDFLGPGELDVLEVLQQVCRTFRVDSDRVYLTGVSAGASGVWTLATHYPHLWAAITPICGRTDYYLWKGFQPGEAAKPRELGIAINSPILVAENLRSLPVDIYHGARDPYIPPTQSSRMFRALEAFGLSRYTEDPEGGHRIWDTLLRDKTLWTRLLSHRRDAMPPRVTYTSFSPKYNRAYWVEVQQVREFGAPIRVDAQITGPHTVALKTENVGRLQLHLPEPADGEPWDVTGLPQDPPADAPYKTATLVGPVENAYCQPFVMVRGTQGSDAERSALARIVDWNVRHWDDYADGLPPVLDDSAVSDDVIASRNLIAFGRPETNLIVAKAAPSLPLRFIEGGFEYQGIEYTGPDVGAVLVYPNPLNPRRLLVVHAGAFWGENRRFIEPNHRLDVLTDIVIFKASGSEFQADTVLCFGWFDAHWQPCPALTSTGPMEPANGA